MKEQPSFTARIESWTREAVETWGDDWARICAHIEMRRTALPPDERRRLDSEAALTLIGADEGARH